MGQSVPPARPRLQAVLAAREEEVPSGAAREARAPIGGAREEEVPSGAAREAGDEAAQTD